jgi:NADH-quinone oxidoreductase subunit J
MIQAILFYAFSFLLLASSAMVIFSERPVKSALFLVLAFVNASALWLMQYAEFLGLALIFVYVGAVMTLFLFVVMMLNVDRLPSGLSLMHRLGLAALVLAILGYLVGVYQWAHPNSVLNIKHLANEPSGSNTKALGALIYSKHVIPVELTALVLLVAMISAIVLVFRGRHPQSKAQKVADQVAANKANRLKIVKD